MSRLGKLTVVAAFILMGSTETLTGQEKEPVEKKTAEETGRKLDEFTGRVEELLKKRDYAKALELCNEAIKFAPQSAQPLYLRGLVNSGVEDIERQFEATERYRMALQDLDAALKIDANHVPALSIRGLIRAAQGKFDEARKDFDAAEKLNPKVDLIFLGRSQVLMQQQAFAKAEQMLDKAVLLNSRRSITYIYRALCKAKGKRWRSALEDASKAVANDPSSPDAYATRAVIRALGMNELRAAAQDLDRALKLNPNHRQAKKNRAQLRKLGY